MRSSMYIVNTNADVAANGVIPLGNVVRRSGCRCALNGTGVAVRGEGDFAFTSSVTVTPVAAGAVGVQFYANGMPIEGATATANAAAGEAVALPVTFEVRMCGCGSASVTARLVSGDATTGATVNNIATRIEAD